MSAYFEVKGTDIKWEYNGKLYSITGQDAGAVAGTKGSTWVEGSYLAYVDQYGHKRLYYLDPTGVFPGGAIPGALFVSPSDNMLRAVDSSGELKLARHFDHNDTMNQYRHQDDSAHGDNMHIDKAHANMGNPLLPLHLDSPFHDDMPAEYAEYNDAEYLEHHADYPDHSDSHWDYTDHYDTHYDYPDHDDKPAWAEWENHSDAPYSDWDDYTGTPHDDSHGDEWYQAPFEPWWPDHMDEHGDQAYSDWHDHSDSSHGDHEDYGDLVYGHFDWDNHADSHSDAEHADVPHEDWRDHVDSHLDKVGMGHSDYSDGAHANWSDHADYTDIISWHVDDLHNDHIDWVDVLHANWTDYQQGTHSDTPRIQNL